MNEQCRFDFGVGYTMCTAVRLPARSPSSSFVLFFGLPRHHPHHHQPSPALTAAPVTMQLSRVSKHTPLSPHTFIPQLWNILQRGLPRPEASPLPSLFSHCHESRNMQFKHDNSHYPDVLCFPLPASGGIGILLKSR